LKNLIDPKLSKFVAKERRKKESSEKQQTEITSDVEKLKESRPQFNEIIEAQIEKRITWS
jgi:hypothetical protein